ncbi:MAG TPA: hypothetical protein VK925_12000 [Jiangellaceae bacterium]|nr:hypothetical protein [Jiangellaceae bacterium]
MWPGIALARAAQDGRPGGRGRAVAQARQLLAELAAVQVTTKRVERSAEADGTIAAETIAAEGGRHRRPLPGSAATSAIFALADKQASGRLTKIWHRYSQPGTGR